MYFLDFPSRLRWFFSILIYFLIFFLASVQVKFFFFSILATASFHCVKGHLRRLFPLSLASHIFLTCLFRCPNHPSWFFFRSDYLHCQHGDYFGWSHFLLYLLIPLVFGLYVGVSFRWLVYFVFAFLWRSMFHFRTKGSGCKFGFITYFLFIDKSIVKCMVQPSCFGNSTV